MSDTKYFVKEIVSNSLRLPSGRKIPWEMVGDDTGVLATNDDHLIGELHRAIAKHIGGVREVDLQGYEDTKKKSIVEESRKASWSRANNKFQRVRKSEESVPAAVAKPIPSKTVSPAGQPIATPKTLPLPKALKRSALMDQKPPDSGLSGLPKGLPLP